MWQYNYNYYSDDELMHYGIVGMKWGKRKAKAAYRVKKSKINSDYQKKADNLSLSTAKYALTAEKAKIADRQARAQYKRDVKTMGKDAAKAKYKKTYAGLENNIKTSADKYGQAMIDYMNRDIDRKRALKKAKKEYRVDKKAYRQEAKAAVSEAKSQYKATKKKLNDAYTKVTNKMDETGDYSNYDNVADKWIADRKAAKSKYKAVKKKYR